MASKINKDNIEITLRGYRLSLLHHYLKEKQKDGDDAVARKNERVISTALHEGKTGKMARKIVEIMNMAMRPNVKIRLTDTQDELCSLCRKKIKKECREYIPYDFSYTTADRQAMHYYGLQKRIYKSTTLAKKLLSKKRVF